MLDKRILTSVLAGTLLTTAAHAADLGMRAPPPLAPLAPAFTWTGFYVGATVGGVFGSNEKSDFTYYDPLECGNALCTTGTTTALPPLSGRENSILGGPEVGFNLQVNSIVYGIEGDWNFANRTSRNGFFAKENCELAGYSPGGCAAINTAIFGQDVFDNFVTTVKGSGDFGTLRARLGYALDHTLLFVTGGLAFGGNTKVTIKDYRFQPIAAAIPDVFYANSGDTDFGFAVGGGLEYAFNSNWSIKAEYLYIDIDHGSRKLLCGSLDCGPLPGNIGTIMEASQHDRFNVVRVGLNYKFGAPPPPAPVVARY